MKPKQRRASGSPASDRVPLAQIKINFSRYVRDVQTQGRSITITQHGRDAAVLAPIPVRPKLTIREAVDPRPLGGLNLRPLPGQGTTSEAIRSALDDEREG